MEQRCAHPEGCKSGFFKRKCDGRRIQRFRCLSCKKTYSSQTHKLTYCSRHPWLDRSLLQSLCSGVSQRRCAENFGFRQKTVARKILRYASWARWAEAKASREHPPAKLVQFDDMETFEHTQCKPLSIALAVDQASRRILSVQVAQMPAKGPLAQRARKKYGPRIDERRLGWQRLFQEVKGQVNQDQVRFESDENPHYPQALRRVFAAPSHVAFKGRRGCVVGQGELKRGGFDPLFSLNHTCAMFRDNLKTLARRTWCTVKKVVCLEALLALYRWYHNHVRLKHPAKLQH